MFCGYQGASHYCQEIIGIIIFKFPEYGKIWSRGDPNESPNLDTARLKNTTDGEYIFLAGRLYSLISSKIDNIFKIHILLTIAVFSEPQW